MKELENFVKTLNKKPVAVFGLARSGLSTVKALQKSGAAVLAWDDSENARAEAKKLGADIQDLTEHNLKTCAFLVLAPGVPLHFPEPHVRQISKSSAISNSFIVLITVTEPSA
jgi:UDP-N-acetylmuramoylalanine--D-glutamate ligase